MNKTKLTNKYQILLVILIVIAVGSAFYFFRKPSQSSDNKQYHIKTTGDELRKRSAEAEKYPDGRVLGVKGKDKAEQEQLVKKVLAEEDKKFLDKYGKYEMGSGQLIWISTKARLMKEYGVNWQTPAEANPNIIYD